ncbi:MAG TPA: hypothetical protein VN892_15155 [Solirubrobacteraceae bacterium]|nr:hypothetical protein [Solirubrobacteraceae bacterium]
MKANVYIDGLNLYYSALRWRFADCKWLDLRRLSQLLLPKDEIDQVKYFTARVSGGAEVTGPRSWVHLL